MLKQSPSRNLRSKGFKVKHAVQICILFAIAIWLLYRARHSHAKGAGYEETTTTSTADLLEETTRGAYDDVLKFGRKGLKPRVEETKVATREEKKHREEEEDETEDKDEDARVDDGGGGDDEADGQGQYRFEDIGGDLGDGFIGEDEDGESEVEGENDDLGIDKKSREALEEHYKGDDASSAVFQNSQAMATNTENGVLRRVITDEENGALRRVMEQQENRYHRMEDAEEDVNDSKLNHRNKAENFQQTMSVSAVNNEEKDATDSKVSHLKQSNESLTGMAIVLPEPAQLRNVKSLGNGSIIPIVMVEHNPNTIRTENEQLNYKANLTSIASDSDDNNRAKGIEDTSQLSKTSEITEAVPMETLDSWEGTSDF